MWLKEWVDTSGCLPLGVVLEDCLEEGENENMIQFDQNFFEDCLKPHAAIIYYSFLQTDKDTLINAINLEWLKHEVCCSSPMHYSINLLSTLYIPHYQSRNGRIVFEK